MNTEFVRRHFAGLDPTPGREWIFLDNAGGSFALRETAERVARYLRETPVQLGGDYPLSREAASRQMGAVTKLANMINAAHDEEVVLGGSATALTWRVARALLPSLQQGDEIVITRMDHEANRSPWLALRRFGVVVHELDIDCDLDGDTWQVNREQLRALLGPRTRVVCIGHCSNILGRIEPIADIAKEVHAAGAKLFVDGVAFAPHRAVDVQALGADFYVMSLYKIFGPHLGMLWGRREELVRLANLNHEYLDDDAIPYKLQPGGASYELVYGASAIPDYLTTLDREQGGDGSGATAWQAIEAHEDELQRPLLEFLAAHSEIDLLGPATTGERLPIISLRPRDGGCASLVEQLQKRNIACRSGHFHARRLLESLDIDPEDGVVRISFAHYNTEDEMWRLLEALKQVLG